MASSLPWSLKASQSRVHRRISEVWIEWWGKFEQKIRQSPSLSPTYLSKVTFFFGKTWPRGCSFFVVVIKKPIKNVHTGTSSDSASSYYYFFAGKLWISYFEEGSTVPPPFNVIPTPKSFFKFFFCQTKKKKKFTVAQKEDAEDRYLG